MFYSRGLVRKDLVIFIIDLGDIGGDTFISSIFHLLKRRDNRGSITYLFGIGKSIIISKHEIDEFMRKVDLAAVPGDQHGVVPHIGSLGRGQISHVFVFADNIGSISRIYHSHGLVSGDHIIDDIVTRIIPRAGDGSNGFIYLDETFVDSEHINEYAVIHVEVLDSQYSVGQTIEHADGTAQTLNRDNVIQRMRQEALDRFYYDQADVPTVTLDVDFVLLGDTEEYREYRNLQRINLYDTIEIDTGSTTVTAQVIGYEWDCLMGRYNGISIGKVYSQARKRIPGYRVATGAITYSKLSPGLIKWIRGAS